LLDTTKARFNNYRVDVFSPTRLEFTMRSTPTITVADVAQQHRTMRFDSLEQEAYLSLWRTYDRLKEIEDALFAEFELSAQQYNALRLLKSVYPAAMQTLLLGQQLISRAPDMTRMLDRLENRGLIERERPPENRRVVEVRISEAGLALCGVLAERVVECHAAQLGHLPPEKLEQLIELLAQVRHPHEQPQSRWSRNQS
jgi:MarR family transcriptional regulator, organic hydroperoxide resistance regulator